MDTLPIELRLKIVRYFDIEVLLSLEYRDGIMWEILRNPTLEKTKTWLVEYVSNFGIIYIKDGTNFGLYDNVEYDEDKDEEYSKKDINLWDSKLPRGFYKLKFLFEGFDIVKIGNYFLSSQDGPLRSFNLEDKKWDTTHKRRGFELVIETVEGLSHNSVYLFSGLKPILKRFTVDDIKPSFYIVYNNINNLLSCNVESKCMNEHSTNSTYSTYNHIITPYILKNKREEVIGYKLQTREWSACDVTDSYSDEGYFVLNVYWYRYLNKEKCNYCGSSPINSIIGFIMSGKQTY